MQMKRRLWSGNRPELYLVLACARLTRLALSDIFYSFALSNSDDGKFTSCWKERLSWIIGSGSGSGHHNSNEAYEQEVVNLW